jgi:hypothetical protein
MNNRGMLTRIGEGAGQVGGALWTDGRMQGWWSGGRMADSRLVAWAGVLTPARCATHSLQAALSLRWDADMGATHDHIPHLHRQWVGRQQHQQQLQASPGLTWPHLASGRGAQVAAELLEQYVGLRAEFQEDAGEEAQQAGLEAQLGPLLALHAICEADPALCISERDPAQYIRTLLPYLPKVRTHAASWPCGPPSLHRF